MMQVGARAFCVWLNNPPESDDAVYSVVLMDRVRVLWALEMISSHPIFV